MNNLIYCQFKWFIDEKWEFKSNEIVNSAVGSVKVYVDKQLDKQKLESDKALTSTSEKVEKLIKVRL